MISALQSSCPLRFFLHRSWKVASLGSRPQNFGVSLLSMTMKMTSTTTHRLHQNQTICMKLSTTTARNSMMTSARLSAPNLHLASKSFNAATRDTLVQWGKKEDKKISLMVPIIETPSADTYNAMSNFPVP